MLPSGKQVLYITIFVLRIHLLNLTPPPPLPENLTAVHLGFSNFVHVSLSENIAAVHLGFSNFMHASLSENLTTMHLGFSNIMHGCRACRQGVLRNTDIQPTEDIPEADLKIKKELKLYNMRILK